MPKRAAPTDNATSSKRFRAAIDESTEEFLCPITQSLPLDPVLAEDGVVYERRAIEDWLKQHARSPKTNLPMGTKLVPAPAIKNMIERMVKTGALSEEKTAEWRKRIEEEAQVVELRRKAEAGDLSAATKLARAYCIGTLGLSKDSSKALPLAKQAADGGDPRGMSTLAMIYYVYPAHQSAALVLRWAAAAAALGDGAAHILLANLYDHGRAGLPLDKEEGFKLRLKGCEMGSANSVGLFNLAESYANGTGTAVDADEAAKWMRKAVARADPPTYAQRARDWLSARGLSP